MTSACDAQNHNEITSLDGAVFPVGFTTLNLVSSRVFLILFCCFVGILFDVQCVCGVGVA